ncbi:MAG: mannose-1-phosphate guanylyltransferase [Myxococcales bacterium]|nr:mannose-1-phosphate guanylyltransferase [Myxococcales bacterium]
MSYAVIMAGGSGTRFWPASRRQRPKQLLSFLTDRNLLQETVDRVLPLFPVERILIVTSVDLGPAVREACPTIPVENILLEPAQRNTAPCIGYAATVVQQRHPSTPMVVLPADHYISDGDHFRDVIADALEHVVGGRMVTLGITPTSPSTAYGYIKFGDFSTGRTDLEHRARELLEFVEKPDLARALQFLQSGRYLWNAGIFVFRSDVMLEEIDRQLPVLSRCLGGIRDAMGTNGYSDAVAAAFSESPSISIDYGVMEHAQDMLVIPAAFGWSDVGSWDALLDFAPQSAENFVHGSTYTLESARNVLYSDGPLVTAVGVENLVVVATADAVLVCSRDRAQLVKQLVLALEERGLSHLL